VANIDLDAIRAQHVQDDRFGQPIIPWCIQCGHELPCVTLHLLAELERKDAALRAARGSIRDCACPINQSTGCRPCAVVRQIDAALSGEGET